MKAMSESLLNIKERAAEIISELWRMIDSLPLTYMHKDIIQERLLSWQFILEDKLYYLAIAERLECARIAASNGHDATATVIRARTCGEEKLP